MLCRYCYYKNNCSYCRYMSACPYFKEIVFGRIPDHHGHDQHDHDHQNDHEHDHHPHVVPLEVQLNEMMQELSSYIPRGIKYKLCKKAVLYGAKILKGMKHPLAKEIGDVTFYKILPKVEAAGEMLSSEIKGMLVEAFKRALPQYLHYKIEPIVDLILEVMSVAVI